VQAGHRGQRVEARRPEDVPDLAKGRVGDLAAGLDAEQSAERIRAVGIDEQASARGRARTRGTLKPTSRPSICESEVAALPEAMFASSRKASSCSSV